MEVSITNEMTEMSAEEKADQEAQEKWLRPSDDNPLKRFALFLLVMYCLWVYLLTLSVMGSGFKLLGGKSSAKMFDFVNNPISGLMIGILATVLVRPPPRPRPSSSRSSGRTSSACATRCS